MFMKIHCFTVSYRYRQLTGHKYKVSWHTQQHKYNQIDKNPYCVQFIDFHLCSFGQSCKSQVFRKIGLKMNDLRKKGWPWLIMVMNVQQKKVSGLPRFLWRSSLSAVFPQLRLRCTYPSRQTLYLRTCKNIYCLPLRNSPQIFAKHWKKKSIVHPVLYLDSGGPFIRGYHHLSYILRPFAELKYTELKYLLYCTGKALHE